MSRPLRCLSSSLRSLNAVSTSSILPPRGTLARKYSVAAMKNHSEEGSRSAPSRKPQRARPRTDMVHEEDRVARRDEGERAPRRRPQEKLETEEERAAEEETWNGPQSTSKKPTPHLTAHLNFLFPELHFPDEVARRILTHGSHPAAVYGHNGAFSFVGRRVMESYLLLMLNSSRSLKSSMDVDEAVARTLNSYTLGQAVGSKWGLGRAMRWTPSIAASQLRQERDQTKMLQSVGLYKVQGDAVSAVMGGVFFQFGASVAHRLFHTRVLPLLVDYGLPQAFNQDADSICKRMGGVEGKLVVLDTPTTPQATQTS